MKDITIGSTHMESIQVNESILAKSVGSGEVAVYATPMMIALMEKAAATLLGSFLEADETSVGTMINTTHEAATPCGMKVSATAEIIKQEGRKIVFQIIAKDEIDIIGTAVHERVVVKKSRFEAKAQAKLSHSS